MTESPDNDSSQATPPLQPFTMPAEPAPGPTTEGVPAPSAAGPYPAPFGTVPPQPGPPPAQPAGAPGQDAWPIPGQPAYGQGPPPPGYGTPPGYAPPGAPPPYGTAPGYGSPQGGYQPYPPGPGGYQPYPSGPGGYPAMGKDPTLAAWWQRLLARVIDYLVVVVITSPVWITVLAGLLHRLTNVVNRYPNPSSPAAQAAIRNVTNSSIGEFVLLGIAAALVWFAYDWLQHGVWGQTLGKRALGTKVVRAADRGRIGAGAAAARAAVFALPPVVPTVGFLFALVNVLSLTWDRQRQCFHDKAGRTIVVKKSSLS